MRSVGFAGALVAAIITSACGSGSEASSSLGNDATTSTPPSSAPASELPSPVCDLSSVPPISVERFEFDMAGAVAECVAVLEAGQGACFELSGAAELAECFEGLEGEATAMLDQAMVLAGELPAVYEFANPDDPRVDAVAWAEQLEAARVSFEGYVSAMCDLTVERSLSLSWSGRESQVGNCEIDLIQSQLTYLAEFSLLD